MHPIAKVNAININHKSGLMTINLIFLRSLDIIVFSALWKSDSISFRRVLISFIFKHIYIFTSTLWSSSNCSICLSKRSCWSSEMELSSEVPLTFASRSDFASVRVDCCSAKRVARSDCRFLVIFISHHL